MAENLTVHGAYNLTAQATSITARSPNAAASLTIDARGEVPRIGPMANNGNLHLRASGTAHLSAARSSTGVYRSQIIMQPAAADQFGLMLESNNGVRIHAAIVDPALQLPHIDVTGNRIFITTGRRADGTAAPWIALDGTAGTVTLGAGGGDGPRIVLGKDDVKIHGTGTTTLTVAADVQVT